jgi:hypothetical protein
MTGGGCEWGIGGGFSVSLISFFIRRVSAANAFMLFLRYFCKSIQKHFSFFFLLEQKETKIQGERPTPISPAKSSQCGGSHSFANAAALLPTYAGVERCDSSRIFSTISLYIRESLSSLILVANPARGMQTKISRT